MKKFASKILNRQISRVSDNHGHGHYGASRGTRTHKGLDIVAVAREKVFSPISGTIIREAFPYRGDKKYIGIVIKGNGEWKGYELKMFYVQGIISGNVNQGDIVGYAQNIAEKYPGITNHIHLEVRRDRVVVDPYEIWQMSF